MPKEDSIREKSLSRWAARQGLDLARVSNPKMGRGFFLVDWEERKLAVGGPTGTLSEIEKWLRANMPEASNPRSRNP
jgi:hypothetical protein